MKPARFVVWLVTLWIALESLESVGAQAPRELARWFGPQTWERDVSEPVLSLGQAGAFDDMHIFAPAVIHERDRFWLWYSGSRGTPGKRVFRVGLATSADGKAFVRHPDNPVLEFKDGARSVLTPTLLRQGDGAVLREDGKLRMWFTAGVLGKPGVQTLHEATSADGVKWSDPSPALAEHVYCPTVLKTERGYEMWFSDVSKRPWVIRHGTSGDGHKWTIDEQAALHLSQPWEGEVLVYPTVLKIDNAYLMWYGSYDSVTRRAKTAIGFAVSLDGSAWHKHPGNPVLRPDPKRPWETNYVGSGSVMRLPDGSFRYWYASRKAPPFRNLYFALGTARWAGSAAEQPAAAEAPEPIREYLRRCEDAKAAALKAGEEERDALTRASNPSPALRQRLLAVEAKLKRLRQEPAALLPLSLPPKKDDIGILENATVDVLEVVGEKDAIVRVWQAREDTFFDLWMHKIAAGRLTAGSSAKMRQVFQVTGNKLFDTTCGQRSLPLLEPVDVESYRR